MRLKYSFILQFAASCLCFCTKSVAVSLSHEMCKIICVYVYQYVKEIAWKHLCDIIICEDAPFVGKTPHFQLYKSPISSSVAADGRHIQRFQVNQIVQ